MDRVTKGHTGEELLEVDEALQVVLHDVNLLSDCSELRHAGAELLVTCRGVICAHPPNSQRRRLLASRFVVLTQNGLDYDAAPLSSPSLGVFLSEQIMTNMTPCNRHLSCSTQVASACRALFSHREVCAKAFARKPLLAEAPDRSPVDRVPGLSCCPGAAARGSHLLPLPPLR